MKYLILSSLFCFFFAACAQAPVTPFWTPELRAPTKKNEYRMLIKTAKANITGICVVKQMDGVWKGAIINEFGLKVLDFESSSKKCKLLHVISFLDKWYIKKVMASDIQFIMEIDHPEFKIGVRAKREWIQDTLIVRNKDKILQRVPNEEVKFFNDKYGLTYSFIRISETISTNTDEK